MIRLLTVTIKNSKDEEIILRDNLDFKLLDIKGLSELQIDVQSEKSPFQNGSTHLASLLDERDIEIKIAVISRSEQDFVDKKMLLSKVLSPFKNPLRIIYSKGEYERELEAYISSYPALIAKYKNRSHYVFDLIATKPEWKDIRMNVSNLIKIAPLFGFELELVDGGIEMGTYMDGNVVVDNKGDVSTPLRFEILGPVTTPRITNQTTGEFIELDLPLLAGEKMIITTDFGNKRADKVDDAGNITSAFQYLNIESTFFQLIPGPNQIAFDAAAGSSDAKIKIEFKNKYLMI